MKKKGRTAPGGSSGGREDTTKTEAATGAGIARSTATQWTALAEFDDAVREAAGDFVETLRKRALLPLGRPSQLSRPTWLGTKRLDMSSRSGRNFSDSFSPTPADT